MNQCICNSPACARYNGLEVTTPVTLFRLYSNRDSYKTNVQLNGSGAFNLIFGAMAVTVIVTSGLALSAFIGEQEYCLKY